MSYLLDTHILLWWLADDRRLSQAARALLADSANTMRVSVVSLWEIAIKSAKGRLRLNFPELIEQIEAGGFQILPIQPKHVETLTTLEPHHADPFDRMLVAQALAEKCHLITADRALSRYGDSIRQA